MKYKANCVHFYKFMFHSIQECSSDLVMILLEGLEITSDFETS